MANTSPQSYFILVLCTKLTMYFTIYNFKTSKHIIIHDMYTFTHYKGMRNIFEFFKIFGFIAYLLLFI